MEFDVHLISISKQFYHVEVILRVPNTGIPISIMMTVPDWHSAIFDVQV